MLPAGLEPPATAPTLSGSGVGSIVGTYSAYVRFVDAEENFSDLSPVSGDYAAAGLTGTITDVTNVTPPVVTTAAAHGLLTGATVKITGVGGANVNSVYVVTVLTPTTFSLNDSAGAGDYTGGGSFTAGFGTITYANVPKPTQTRVARRQILRHSDGQATTFYVDVDTSDLLSATLTSTRGDQELVAQTAVPLLASDGTPLANRHGVPPAHKTILAAHLDRMFMAGEIDYRQGSVVLTFGSTLVRGLGTEFTAKMVGRYFYGAGASRSYQIASVDVTNQTLTIDRPYQNVSDPYSAYAVRPAPAERRLVYYSEPGLPESWPAFNALSVQEDGDELTGLMPMGSFLYFLERRHVYRFTFQSDPATDGYVFLSTASRGCVNNRSWVIIEDVCYMLDEQGVHAFSGGKSSEPVSTPIQDIFRKDGVFRVNWSASVNFHAAHSPAEEVIRFFVSLDGHYLPRHALAYQYRTKRWWIEEYDLPIGASCRVEVDGAARTFLGSSAARVLLSDEGTLDGPDPSAGTTRGTATSATLLSLTDVAAGFAGLTGFAVTIVDGKGAGQTRGIVSHTATTLKILLPWTTMPDATSVYQVGGIRWKYRTGWFRYVHDEEENPRGFNVVFEPLSDGALMTARVYLDQSGDPVVWQNPYSLTEGTGVRSAKDSPDLVADLTKSLGFIQKRYDGHREYYADGPRFVSLDLSGVQGVDRVQLYQVTIDGVLGAGGQ